jgi:DNA-binding XRE family transcriptional regulator
MPNIAVVLKEEIRRLARQEAKLQIGKTQRATVQYRRDIAKLKRQLSQQDRQLKTLRREITAGPGEVTSGDEGMGNTRFSARSVKAQRRRLGLSAADYGRLIGVSGLTIYHWEQGKSRPRSAQFAALCAVRGIGKREALRRLAEGQELRSPAQR